MQRLMTISNFTEALNISLHLTSLKFLDPVNNIVPKVLMTCNLIFVYLDSLTLIFVYLYSLTLSVNGHSLSKIDSSCKIIYSN